MQKFNYRKHAIAALSLLIVGTLAACSGASSTDEALTHPGDVIGTYQFDVNPSSSNVTVTTVGSPWIGTKVVGDGAGNIPNVAITTSNVSYLAPTMDFWVKVKWTDPDEDLWNVRIQTNATTNVNVKNLQDDRCTGATPWGTCLSGANPPAITFVSDLTSEGPESRLICTADGFTCETQYKNNLNAGCGQISTHWQLNEAGGAGYKFWADLYGTKAPIDPLLDARYDQYTATVWNKVKKLTYGTTNLPVEGAESNTMAPNEWFYVRLYADAPGNNQAWPFYYWELDANGGYLSPQHIEDTGNVAAYQSGTNSTANFVYVGMWLPYSVRFDNAVIEIPATDGAQGGLPPLLVGTKFCTASGTRILFRLDSNGTTDGWDSTTNGLTASNNLGMVFALGNKPTVVIPNPCGNRALGAGCPGGSRDGFANANMDIVRLPLHVKSTAVIGQSSYIVPSFDTYSFFAAYGTEGTALNSGDDQGFNVDYSTNWPVEWCELMPGGSCVKSPIGGMYNLERNYICVQ